MFIGEIRHQLPQTPFTFGSSSAHTENGAEEKELHFFLILPPLGSALKVMLRRLQRCPSELYFQVSGPALHTQYGLHRHVERMDVGLRTWVRMSRGETPQSLCGGLGPRGPVPRGWPNGPEGCCVPPGGSV